MEPILSREHYKCLVDLLDTALLIHEGNPMARIVTEAIIADYDGTIALGVSVGLIAGIIKQLLGLVDNDYSFETYVKFMAAHYEQYVETETNDS